jgi:SAM-dependent methyltransferase
MSHKRDWEDLARVDPLWAILTEPARKFNRWNVDEFFATGESEIAEILGRASELGYPRSRDSALDFGCGVGRLVRALGTRFRQCTGVDISREMIAKAEELNAGRPSLTFLVSDERSKFPDGSFDFVYTSLVLQHLRSRAMILERISELFRTLRSGGLFVFQLPSHIPLRQRFQLRPRLYGLLRSIGLSARFLYRRLDMNPMRMNFISEDKVRRHVDGMGGRTLDVRRNTCDGILSCVYFVAKPER